MNKIKNSWEVQIAALNLQSVNAFSAIKTIRVGDYVRHLSGKEAVVAFFTGAWYQFRPVLKQKHENVESGNISNNPSLGITDTEHVIQTEINLEN